MAVRAREQALLPVYRQMATTFAQMHDSPVRMVAKGVLRGIVPWHQARPFLSARLRRRCVPSHTCSCCSHLWFCTSQRKLAPTSALCPQNMLRKLWLQGLLDCYIADAHSPSGTPMHKRRARGILCMRSDVSASLGIGAI